mgnify:CR=1 FL=1
MPGMEIGIAKAYYKADRMSTNVTFQLVDDEIVMQPNVKRNDS